MNLFDTFMLVVIAACFQVTSSFVIRPHNRNNCIIGNDRILTQSKKWISNKGNNNKRHMLFAELNKDENNETSISSLSPSSEKSSISSLPPSSQSSSQTTNDITSLSAESISSSGTSSALFINQQTKRILIEELGYKRVEVERLRPELAAPIISKRLFRPDTIPAEWLIAEDETSRAMLERLENESKYPLKFPLLAVSLILFGKGFGDALITLIKVNIDFPGASLTASFMGFPVLAIDVICAIVGGALGFWTWKTMKD